MNLSRRGLLAGFLGMCAAAPLARLEPLIQTVLPVIQSKGITYTSLQAMNDVLKRYWSDEAVENLVYEDNPFLAMVPKCPQSVKT